MNYGRLWGFDRGGGRRSQPVAPPVDACAHLGQTVPLGQHHSVNGHFLRVETVPKQRHQCPAGQVGTGHQVAQAGHADAVQHQRQRGPAVVAAGVAVHLPEAGHVLTRGHLHPLAGPVLIGIETYNGSAIDRLSNHYAEIFANTLPIAHIGNSDAHTIDTLGFGATEFPGTTAADLLLSIRERTTQVRKMNEWSAVRVLGSWGFRYLESAFARLSLVSQVQTQSQAQA